MACDMPEPCKFPSFDSYHKRFLWTHKEVDLAPHPVIGLVLQVGDAEGLPQAPDGQVIDSHLPGQPRTDGSADDGGDDGDDDYPVDFHTLIFTSILCWKYGWPLLGKATVAGARAALTHMTLMAMIA